MFVDPRIINTWQNFAVDKSPIFTSFTRQCKLQQGLHALQDDTNDAEGLLNKQVHIASTPGKHVEAKYELCFVGWLVGLFNLYAVQINGIIGAIWGCQLR